MYSKCTFATDNMLIVVFCITVIAEMQYYIIH